jgi:hypothetical protein
MACAWPHDERERDRCLGGNRCNDQLLLLLNHESALRRCNRPRKGPQVCARHRSRGGGGWVSRGWSRGVLLAAQHIPADLLPYT